MYEAVGRSAGRGALSHGHGFLVGNFFAISYLKLETSATTHDNGGCGHHFSCIHWNCIPSPDPSVGFEPGPGEGCASDAAALSSGTKSSAFVFREKIHQATLCPVVGGVSEKIKNGDEPSLIEREPTSKTNSFGATDATSLSGVNQPTKLILQLCSLEVPRKRLTAFTELAEGWIILRHGQGEQSIR